MSGIPTLSEIGSYLGVGGDDGDNPISNPIGYMFNQFHQGQARDEARSIRAGDIERDQKNFERNTITGRIQEGAAHGLSKLASIGAQPNNSMTATVGQALPSLSSGQNINPHSRLEAQLLNSQIEGVRLDNLKKAQDLRTSSTGSPDQGGFMPGTKRSNHGSHIVEKPMERTSTFPGKPHMEPGAVAGSGFEVTPTGLAPIPSGDVKERIEDSPYELRNFFRYGILPNFGNVTGEPPKSALPRGADAWRWNSQAQEYQPYSLKDRAIHGYHGKKSMWSDFINSIKSNYRIESGPGGRPQGSYLNYRGTRGTWKGE